MIIKPFGPKIYKTELSQSICEKLEQIILQNQLSETNKVNKQLAGFVSNEINILSEISAEILPVLKNIVIDYLNTSKSFIEKFKPFHTRDIECVASWANIMQQNEFFPLHNHPTSDIVVVTFPKVEIQTSSPYVTNHNSDPGSLMFSYGEGLSYFNDSSYIVSPKTRDVFVFPAELKHCTFPIYGNDTRISTSTNFKFSDYLKLKLK